jgi:hypothetical protein
MLEAYRRERNNNSGNAHSVDAIYNEQMRRLYLVENRGINEAALPPGDTIDFLINCFGYSLETVDVCEYAIPTFEQIKEAIDEGYPLLCFVKRGAPESVFDYDERRFFRREGRGGQGIIICGYDETGGGENILVADPALEGITTIPYSPTKYVEGIYWWATVLKKFD